MAGMMSLKKKGFVFALLTTLFWGVWGAFIEIPEKAGFPASLGYIVWSLSMIPPALAALYNIKWKLDRRRKPVFAGLLIGFTGAAGQLLLFQALRTGPAYLVFPFISLSPIVTILLSMWLLKERASAKAWAGIGIALLAILLLSYQPAGNNQTYGHTWMILTLMVFLCWGVQAFLMRKANMYTNAESIFFYMMCTGIFLVPVALAMTDFTQAINWGFKGPYLAFFIQLLNAIGALLIVYAFRYGKAIIVSPLTNAGAPLMTVVLSLTLYSIIPHPFIITGMVLAIVAILLLAE